jgi:hypothetical protein
MPASSAYQAQPAAPQSTRYEPPPGPPPGYSPQSHEQNALPQMTEPSYLFWVQQALLYQQQGQAANTAQSISAVLPQLYGLQDPVQAAAYSTHEQLWGYNTASLSNHIRYNAEYSMNVTNTGWPASYHAFEDASIYDTPSNPAPNPTWPYTTTATGVSVFLELIIARLCLTSLYYQYPSPRRQ